MAGDKQVYVLQGLSSFKYDTKFSVLFKSLLIQQQLASIFTGPIDYAGYKCLHVH